MAALFGFQNWDELVQEKLGRPLTDVELQHLSDTYNRTKRNHGQVIISTLGVLKANDDQARRDISNIYRAETGKDATPEQIEQLRQQFSPNATTGLKTEDVRGRIAGDTLRDKEATQKAEQDKLIADQRKREEEYFGEQKRLDEERQIQLRQDQELERLSGSIGGVSPSELSQLRAAVTPPSGTVTTGLAPDQIVQDILGKRKADIDKQSEGFSTLRDSLRQKFDTSRTNLATAQDEALNKYQTVAQNVENSVLKRLLPQIQAQLAALGLETGGGAFQVQTAQLATDLAAQTEGQVASRRLDLDTERANLARGDEQALTDLELQQSEIIRQKQEAERLAREGRLDNLTLQRLQANVDEFNRRANLVGQREFGSTNFIQNLQGQGNQNNFTSLQNAFNQKEQQLNRDLQARQFEQTMAFNQQQFQAQQAAANKKPSIGSTVAKIAVPLVGAGIGAYAGGPQGASTGYSMGSSVSNMIDPAHPTSLRSQFQTPRYYSPTTSFIYQ